MLSRTGVAWRIRCSQAGFRRWTSTARHNGNSATRIFAGTVTASQPSRTSINALLDKAAERTAWPNSTITGSRSASIVLLLTPTYARHALDPDLPVEIFNKLMRTTPSGQSLESITAVVDHLPVQDPGLNHEGLAYALVLDGSMLDTSQDGVELQSTTRKPGYVNIVFPRMALPSKGIPMPSTLRLQLPLAQTVFSTGLVSTLIHTSYRSENTGNTPQLHSMRQLESHTLTLPFTPRNIEFSVPLTLLTRPAVVDYSMGNIIRTITSLDEQGRHPASQELEAAISSYFQSQETSPEPVNVWALVIPSLTSGMPMSKTVHDMLELADQIEADASKRKSFPANLLNSECVTALLNHGARFHKVLSGGGGWGKKAGLLSLDPDVFYSTRELRGEQGWNFDFSEGDKTDIQRQKEQALGQIVRRGETIMFFLAPKNTCSPAFVLPKLQEAGKSGNTCQAIFGALPSSVDTVIDVEADNSTIHFHEGVFGALSEGGMALRLDSPALYTKFDMPFSRITTSGSDTMDASGLR